MTDFTIFDNAGFIIGYEPDERHARARFTSGGRAFAYAKGNIVFRRAYSVPQCWIESSYEGLFNRPFSKLFAA